MKDDIRDWLADRAIRVYGAVGHRAGWAWTRAGAWLAVRVPGFEDGMDDAHV